MFDGVLPALLVSLVSGGAAGLITWGAIRVELKWLRRDTDLAHARLDELEDDVQALRERRTSRVPARTRDVRRRTRPNPTRR